MSFNQEDSYCSAYLGEHMDPYDSVLPTGIPSFAHLPPPGRHQYSSMGRMDAEFLGNDAIPDGVTEDERPIVARGKTTRILGYSPREGQSGTLITVRLVFRQGRMPPKTKVALRVKMGNIPLMTSIYGIQPTGMVAGEWQLQVVAPDPIELNIAGMRVPLIVQTLDCSNAVIVDDVCIGAFKFVSPALTEHPIDSKSTAHESTVPSSTIDTHGRPLPDGSTLSRRAEDTTVDEDANFTPDSSSASLQLSTKYAISTRPNRKRARLSIEVPSCEVPDNIYDELTPGPISPTATKDPLTQLPQKPGESTYQGTLKFHGNLNSITAEWSEEEEQNNRRLVEFFSTQQNGHIDLRFAPITGDSALNQDKIVVSCIWWDEMEDFVITSVDTINLLEKLVGTKFTTEEKNRIRRNLQGFKPLTVSKNQADSESFFKLLMDFPAPRPRNIEKDVKAFPWTKLESMIEKIISKYWFITSPGELNSEGQVGPQTVRIVRDPESISGDSPSAIGLPLPSSATTPTYRSPAETRGPRTGVLPVLDQFTATSTSDDISPSETKLPKGDSYSETPSSYAQGISMFDPIDSLTEISEDSMHEVQMVGDHETVSYHGHPEQYSIAFENGPEVSPYLHEPSVGELEAHEGMPFAVHTFQNYD